MSQRVERNGNSDATIGKDGHFKEVYAAGVSKENHARRRQSRDNGVIILKGI